MYIVGISISSINALDEFEEITQQKHHRYKLFDAQGPPVEH